jgi:hypothetical protein
VPVHRAVCDAVRQHRAKRRAVARCEWIAAIESLNSGATTDGVRVLKEKAAKLGANAVLMSGVLARGPQGAVAYRCEKQPKEELPY